MPASKLWILINHLVSWTLEAVHEKTLAKSTAIIYRYVLFKQGKDLEMYSICVKTYQNAPR